MSWFSEICSDLSNEVAAATGAIYGAGALSVTGGNIPASAAVTEIITQTVDDGWSNGVCVAPGIVYDAISSGSSGGDLSSPAVGDGTA